jgi:2-C-methyl-D-erythritol 4-phosphate cytidylyltransferase
MKIAVIIPAAGLGKRFTADTTANNINKVELDLAGKPVFLHTIELFGQRDEVSQVILAVNPDQLDDFRFRWGDKLGFFNVQIVSGGKHERWETVHNALQHIDSDTTHIAVHDAARPLTSQQLIDRVFAAADRFDAVIPALPVIATLKRVTENENTPMSDDDPLDAILGQVGKVAITTSKVAETIDRTNIVEVQTPQMFEANLLRRAYAPMAAGSMSASSVTDDASLVEALGQPVYVVEGESTNLKITRPADATLAKAIIENRKAQAAKNLSPKRLFIDEDD